MKKGSQKEYTNDSSHFCALLVYIFSCRSWPVEKLCMSYLFIASSELCCLSLTTFQKQVHGEQSYLLYPSPLITITFFFLIFCFQFFSLYLYPWSYTGFDSLKTKKWRCSAERKNCFFFLFALFLSIRVLYYPLTVNTMSPLQKRGGYSAQPLRVSEHHKKLLESFNLPAEKMPHLLRCTAAAEGLQVQQPLSYPVLCR